MIFFNVSFEIKSKNRQFVKVFGRLVPSEISVNSVKNSLRYVGRPWAANQWRSFVFFY